MSQALRMSRKAFTVAVVATTIAWSIGLSALLAPLAASAVSAGTLIKASLPAVYYVGSDMKRYVFPNEKTYKTWYADFSGVQVITDAELASLSIGGNVTYKPGVKMVKITTDPKVYAVDAHGTLRWVTSEAVAVALYGANWNRMIEDVSDAFFTNYTIGSDVASASAFNPSSVSTAALSINVDKNLGVAVSGELSVMLSSSQPVGGTLPLAATGVNVLKFDVRNSSSAAMTVGSVTVRRTGPGRSADFASVYVYEGNNRLSTGRTLSSSSNDATVSGLNLTLAAGETKNMWIAADVSATGLAGDVNSFQVTSVTSGSAVASGLPVSGPSFTLAGVSVGSVTISKGSTVSNPKAGQLAANVAEFKLDASGSEDIVVNKIVLYSAGTINRGNITNLVLKQNGTTVASVAGINSKDQAVFVLATPFSIAKGNTRIFDVYADIVGTTRSGETIEFYLEQAADVLAIGSTYGYGTQVINASYDGIGTNYSLSTVQAGQLTISFNGPASKNVAANAKDVELFNFSMAAAANLEVKKTSIDIVQSGTTVLADYTDVKIVDVATGAIVAGPHDLADGGTTVVEDNAAAGGNNNSVCQAGEACTMAFTEVYDLAAGQTRTFKVTADVNSAAASASQVSITLDAFGAADVRNMDNSMNLVPANDIVPSSSIGGNSVTIQAASLGIVVGSTPVSQTYIKGATGVALLSLGLQAGDANDVKVSSIKVTGYCDSHVSAPTTFTKGSDGTCIVSNMVMTAGLWNGSTQVSATKSPASGTDGTMIFDNLNLTILAGQSVGLTLKGSLASSITGLPAPTDGWRVKFDVSAVGDVSATDADGNTLVEAGEPINGTTADSGIRMSIKASGSITVAKATDDVESEEGLVIGGSSNAVLAKYKLTAVDEELSLSKVSFKIATAVAASSLSLYDGSTLVGGPSGVAVNADLSGKVDFTGLSMIIPKDGSKVLTVKGTMTTVGASGATSGDLATIIMMDTVVGPPSYSFEARGTAGSTVISAITGGNKTANPKILRKSKPTVSLVALPTSVLGSGNQVILQFNVAADAAGDVAFGQLTANVSKSSTTMVMAKSSSGDNYTLKRVGGDYVPATVTWTTPGTTQLKIELTGEETVAAGTSRTYQILVSLTLAGTGDSVSANLVEDTAVVAPVIFATAKAATDNKFVWSDVSKVGHDYTTADWVSGYKVKALPTDSQTMSK